MSKMNSRKLWFAVGLCVMIFTSTTIFYAKSFMNTTEYLQCLGMLIVIFGMYAGVNIADKFSPPKSNGL